MHVIVKHSKHAENIYQNLNQSEIKDNFCDCHVVCSDGVLSFNRMLLGLAFAELASSSSFSMLPEVTVIMSGFSTAEVSQTVQGVVDFWNMDGNIPEDLNSIEDVEDETANVTIEPVIEAMIIKQEFENTESEDMISNDDNGSDLEDSGYLKSYDQHTINDIHMCGRNVPLSYHYCPVCSRQYMNKNSLTRHINRKHNIYKNKEEGKFPCSCGKKFKHRSGPYKCVKKHTSNESKEILSFDSDIDAEKTYACTCGKSYIYEISTYECKMNHSSSNLSEMTQSNNDEKS